MSKFGEFQLPTHFDLMSLVQDYLPKPHSASETSLLHKAHTADMEEHAYHLTVQRLTQEMQAGQNCFGLMSIMKLVHTEQEIVKFEILLDAMGYRAGGSSEVQLNVIAKRVLQLPENKGVST